MSVYLIADVKVTDESWIPEYAENVHAIVDKHGGKYLTRTSNIRTVEGEGLDTSMIALLEFPSMEACEAFMADPEYAPYADARKQGSISRFHILDGRDVAGTIPYLV